MMKKTLRFVLLLLCGLTTMAAAAATMKRTIVNNKKRVENDQEPISRHSRQSNSVLFASDLALNLLEDYKCDFSNRTLAQTVRFVRSPYNCRVFHVCAYWKQFSLTCIDGLYFDENLNTCSYEYLVDCPIDNKLIGTDKDTANNRLMEQLQNQTAAAAAASELPLNAAASINTTATVAAAAAVFSTQTIISNRPTATTVSTTTITTSSSSTTTTTTASTTTTSASTPTTTSAIATQPSSTSPISTPKYSPITYLLFSYDSKNNNNNSETASSSSSSTAEEESMSPSVKSTFDPTLINLSSQQQQQQQQFSSLTLLSSNQTQTSPEDVLTSVASNSSSTITHSTTSSSFYDRLLETTNYPNLYLNTDVKVDAVASNGSRPWWLSPTECVVGFEHRIPHKDNCGKYYECQLNGEKTERACPYPQQFDELYSECRQYNLVDCGKRAQAKDLCDYKLSNTLFQTIPCSLYPSCKNLSDGLYPDELRDCRHYFQCKDQRTLRTFSCPQNTTYGVNLKFNFMTRRCDLVEYVSFNCGGYTIPVDIYTNEMKCPSHSNPNLMQLSLSEQQPSMLAFDIKEIYFSHPKDCTVYLRCDKNANMTRLECPEGTHFSPYYQSCVHPSIANCKKYLLMDDSPILPSRFYQRGAGTNSASLHGRSGQRSFSKYNEILMDFVPSSSASSSSSSNDSFEK